MRTPDATRMRRIRRRRSLGLRVVPVEIGGEAVELLKKRGYEPRHRGHRGRQGPDELRELGDPKVILAEEALKVIAFGKILW